MPVIQKITGNYIELLEKMFPENSKARGDFISDCSNIVDDLLKDLPRNPFFPSNGKSYEDHIVAWLVSAKSKAFTQGNMTASFYRLISQSFIFQSPHFIPKDEKGETLPLNEDNQLKLLGTLKDFSVAYFDDTGIPCGASIVYSKQDPSFWTASIIRNTTAAPEDREVLVLSSQDMMNLGNEGLTSVADAAASFFTFLNSQELKRKIGEEAFTAEGTVNIEQLNKLVKFRDTLLEGCTEKIEPLKANIKLSEANIKLSEGNIRAILSEQDALKNKYDKQLKEIKDPKLEKAASQSFFDRNATSIAVAALGLVTLIGLSLMATGLLAPLGLVLVGTAGMVIGALCTGSAAALVAGSALKIFFDNKKLTDYQSKQKELKSDYKNNCSKIGAETRSTLKKSEEDTGPSSAHPLTALHTQKPANENIDAAVQEERRPTLRSTVPASSSSDELPSDPDTPNYPAPK